MESIKTALFDNPMPIYIALAPLDVIFLIAFLIAGRSAAASCWPAPSGPWPQSSD